MEASTEDLRGVCVVMEDEDGGIDVWVEDVQVEKVVCVKASALGFVGWSPVVSNVKVSPIEALTFTNCRDALQ